MSGIRQALAQLLDGRDLSRDEARAAMAVIMAGEATDAQIAGFLVALRAKGETADEIAGCAESMREHVLRVNPSRTDLVDVVGTGGDGANTYNISTAAALVAAAAGAAVAKHGNRAASSQTGSADVLEALGFRLELPPERIERSIDELGFGFLFAQAHHPAMRHAAPVRRELATRTVFNVLGPLTNPAGARALVLGTYSPQLARTLADALVRLETTRAYVVHGAGGIDELSPAGPNLVCEVETGRVREYELDPRELGIERCEPDELRGGDPQTNAAALRAVLAGADGGHRSAVILNAAGGIAAAGHAENLREGIELARTAIDSGTAASRLDRARGVLPLVRFADALAQPGFGAIAEFKRRSPSAGDIDPAARVEDLVRAYDAAGARAVSVLVDAAFAGSLDDLRAAGTATGLPLLAKGFFSTEEHLRELREAGADAALLILRDLDDETAARLMRAADELGLDTLVEAHDGAELERATSLDARVIGVNARDLGTFRIDRRAQLDLVAAAPRDRVVVAESAIHTRAQAAAAELAGADAVLVGTALMRAAEPQTKLGELLSRPLVKVCGLTRQEDVDAAVEAGADMCGFIFAEGSPRKASDVLPVPETVLSVSVFVGEPEERGTDLVQLYERETRTVRGRDAVLLRDGEPVARVADLPWEGEDPDHWANAPRNDRLVLAGRLGPDNVRAAVEAVQPWAVDAASRLESAPGIKDHEKVRAFVREAR